MIILKQIVYFISFHLYNIDDDGITIKQMEDKMPEFSREDIVESVVQLSNSNELILIPAIDDYYLYIKDSPLLSKWYIYQPKVLDIRTLNDSESDNETETSNPTPPSPPSQSPPPPPSNSLEDENEIINKPKKRLSPVVETIQNVKRRRRRSSVELIQTQTFEERIASEKRERLRTGNYIDLTDGKNKHSDIELDLDICKSIIRPWIELNGEVNTNLYEKIKNQIKLYIIENPGVSELNICKLMPTFHPVDIYFILDELRSEGNVYIELFKVKHAESMFDDDEIEKLNEYSNELYNLYFNLHRLWRTDKNGDYECHYYFIDKI